MSTSKPESPPEPPGAPAKVSKTRPKAGRSDRLADALRDNLKRRKAQARARRQPGQGDHEG